MKSCVLKKTIKNQFGSTMVYALLVGAAVIGLSTYGWQSIQNYKSEEKKSLQRTEVHRDFEIIKRYFSQRRICDYHVKEFRGEDPRKSVEKAFGNLVTVNNLGLSGRTISKLSYDGSGKLITHPSLAKVLGISFKRPAVEPKSIGFGKLKYYYPAPSDISLEVQYGQCTDQDSQCEKSELKVQTFKLNIPVAISFSLNGKTISRVNCKIPLSDLQKEALSKACSGVGGRIDDLDQICKFPVFDPCKQFRESTPDIEKFKTCMLQHVDKEIEATEYIPFQDSVCKLDLITAENSAKAANYSPAILAKDPISGQTVIKAGSNTGEKWRATTKYCSKIKAWKK
jgi:hypothetical protein